MEFIQTALEFLKSELVATIAISVLLVVELWLGKTNLVKSGSTLELILNSVKKVLEFFKVKKPS